MIYDAVVEDVNDPLKLGRVRVRVFGLHTDNTAMIPTEDLTWGRVLMPVTSASVSGIGASPTGLLPGSWVMVVFQDAEQQYPIIIGSYHGVPSKNEDTTKANDELSFATVAIDQSEDVKASKGDYVPTGDDSVKLPSTLDPYDLTGMPMVPPPGTPNSAEATRNIALIVNACKAAGLTTRRAISSVLGVFGGECMWIPTKGNYNYSAGRLVEVFPSVFPNIDAAKPYANNPTELPEKLYGVGTPKGKVLGNTAIGDASKYIDRGFTQLLGKYNYDRYAKLASVDILNNPDLLVTNPTISAKVSVAYVIDRVKTSQLSDGYFDEVKKQVGYNTPDIAIKKRRFYEYFMTGVVSKTNVADGVDTTDPAKFNIIQSNDPAIFSAKAGFNDPAGKYPTYVDEQDTSRLCRREKIETTVVQKKNDNRIKGIDSGNVTWDEQMSPYNSSYPNNKVFESQSGHVIEMDDTPNSERLHIYHKSGSYIEIDNTGSRTTRIVGSSYEIIDYNGHLFVTGACNVTIGGNANLVIGGDMQAKVSGDVDLSVGGDIKAISQNIIMEALGTISLRAAVGVAIDGANVAIQAGASQPSGLSIPGFAKSETKPNPVPTKASDAKAVLFESDGDSSAGDKLIKELIANGEISADVALRSPSEGESYTATGSNKPLLPASCAAIASMERFPDNLKLSPNFTLGMVSSGAAVSSASVRDQDGLHKEEIVCNLQNLCLNALESIKAKYPNMFVTSGFRYPGSNSKSQHPKGEAADIQFRGVSKHEYFKIASELVAIIPVFDQMLLEYSVTSNNPWIHISCTRKSNRRQVMTFHNHKKYKDGLVNLA